MVYVPPPDLAGLSLTQVAEQVAARKLPPLEQWSPRETDDSRMRIAANGTWYHEGSEIGRPAMVRAFSGLLLREGDAHFLLTPFQRLSIEVEDAPFIAVDVVRRDAELVFRLNTDDLVIAGPKHPIISRGDEKTPALYVAVRRGLEARLDRSTYRQLAEIALAESDDWTVGSGGETFSLLPR